MASPLVIFLHSAGYDRLYQATNLLVTASSMGTRCYLFLFYQALASYMAGTWDEVNIDENGAGSAAATLRKSFELADSPSLYDLLARAKEETGGLTICACSASTRFLGLEPIDVKKKVDEIVGLSTMLQIASESNQVLYI